MDKNELAWLVLEEGLKGDVTISGRDLHELLEISDAYDLLVTWAKGIAEREFTIDDAKKLFEDELHTQERVRDKVHAPCAGGSLMRGRVSDLVWVIQSAKDQLMLAPPPSWDKL